MCYADVTYILGLTPQKDVWCQEHVETLEEKLEEDNHTVYASEATILELLFVSQNNDLNPVQLMRDVIPLVELVNISDDTVFKAAMYMQNYDTDPADSLHMAHSLEEEKRLITTDRDIQDALDEITGIPNYINLRSPDPSI